MKPKQHENAPRSLKLKRPQENRYNHVSVYFDRTWKRRGSAKMKESRK